MKRGLISLIIFLFAFIFLAGSVLAYNGYGSNYGFSISDFAQSEMVNVALLFILIFAVCWFVLEQVFHSSKGAAFIISLVLALMGSFGTIYYYGPIIPQVGWWVVALFIVVIGAIVWNQFRGKGPFFWIALVVSALLWLLWLRPQLCPYIFPYMVCIILDALTIAIIIFAIFNFIIKQAFRSRERLGRKIEERKELKRIEELEKAKEKGKIKALKEEARRRKELEKIERKQRERKEKEQKRVEIKKRERTAAELQSKWNHYQRIYEQEWNRYQDRARREGFRKGIPPRSSPEGHKRMWALKAMKAIEKMAKQKGIKLKTRKF